jgi:hypothetical protein
MLSLSGNRIAAIRLRYNCSGSDNNAVVTCLQYSLQYDNAAVSGAAVFNVESVRHEAKQIDESSTSKAIFFQTWH